MTSFFHPKFRVLNEFIATNPGGDPPRGRRAPKPFDESEHEALVREFGVHFSLKTVNSTIPHGGIRLAAGDRIALPYLGVRTLGPDAVPVDLIANPVANAGHFKTYITSRAGGDAPDDAPSLSSETMLKAHAPLCRGGVEQNLDRVHAALRQLLLPREDGTYVAMTPMSSTGLAFVIRERIARHHEALRNDVAPERARRRFHGSVLQIGGSKSINVGVLTYAMTSPPYFAMPTRDPGLRQALGIHYGGVGLVLRDADLVEFKTWWNAAKQSARRSAGGRGRLGAAARRRLQRHLRDVVACCIGQAARVREILDRYADDLPSPGFADHVSPVFDGLVSGRYHPGWVRLFARELSDRLARHTFRHTENAHFDLDADDLHDFARRIERLCATLLRPAL